METEYISREAAIVEIKRFIGYLDEDMIERLQVAIKRIPAEDVQPVVRGEYEKRTVLFPLPWDGGPLDYDNYDEKTHSEREEHWVCPNCGKDFGESRPTDSFCSKCGAALSIIIRSDRGI